MSIAAVRILPRLAGVLLAAAVLVGAALPAHAAPTNPAPAQKLAGYAGYELKPMAIESSLTAKNNSEKVVATVQEHIDRTVAPIVAKWNAEAASATSSEKLVIEPKITALHKPSGATRFFAGALAGDGRIVVTVNIHEAGSGKVIATPEFYRRANGMAGAWTVGAHDNAMLGKVVGADRRLSERELLGSGRRRDRLRAVVAPRLGCAKSRSPRRLPARGLRPERPVTAQSNGWRRTIVCSRSGPVLTMSSGTPASCSMRSRYARAVAGRFA